MERNRAAGAIDVTGHKVMLPSLNTRQRLEEEQQGQLATACSEQWNLRTLSAGRVWQSSTNKQERSFVGDATQKTIT